MNFSTFFSKQARKPYGLFGHFVMSFVFDKGNAFLNDFVNEIISIQTIIKGLIVKTNESDCSDIMFSLKLTHTDFTR